MDLKRKYFLVQVMSAGFALKLAGCGGGGDAATSSPSPSPAPSPSPSPSPSPAPGPSPAPAPPPLTNCTGLTFSANHGHILVIPVADLNATVAKTYNVQGTGGHNHQVTLSPGQIAQLRAGGMVSVATSFDAGHAHTMSGGCT